MAKIERWDQFCDRIVNTLTDNSPTEYGYECMDKAMDIFKVHKDIIFQDKALSVFSKLCKDIAASCLVELWNIPSLQHRRIRTDWYQPLIDRIGRLHDRKNTDYSYADWREDGMVARYFDLRRKYIRLKRAQTGAELLVKEPPTETLRDFFVYCAMMWQLTQEKMEVKE